MPDKIDWDGLVADVLKRGTDVPEIPWFKPGEDAAYDVSKMLFVSQLSNPGRMSQHVQFIDAMCL